MPSEKPFGATVNGFAPLSLDPPMIGVALDRRSLIVTQTLETTLVAVIESAGSTGRCSVEAATTGRVSLGVNVQPRIGLAQKNLRKPKKYIASRKIVCHW